MSLDKNCILCKEFYLDSASRGYSELTPAEPMRMCCNKNKWRLSAWDYRQNTESFRKTLCTAETCPDFVHHKEADNGS